MEILVLLRANIKQRKGNFIGILLFMTIIVALFTSSINIKENLERHYNEANKNVNSGDLVVYIDDKVINEELLQKVKENKMVESIKRTKDLVVTSCTIANNKLQTYIYLTSQDEENYPYKVFDDNRNEVERDKVKLKENEIYIPIVLKKTYSLKIGDTVKLKAQNGDKEYILKGFIEEPLMGADVMGARVFVLSKEEYNRLDKNQINDSNFTPTSMLHIFFNNKSKFSLEDLCKKLDADTNIIKLGIASLTIEHSKSYTLLISDILCSVLESFVGILFVIVLLVLANNIQTSIEMEYENIGILKSQGFTKGKIRGILVLQHLLPGILGSFLGLILANGIIPFLREIFMQTTGLVFHVDFVFFKSLICIVALLSILVIIIFIKSRKVSKIAPIVAISGGLEPVHFNSVIHNKVICNRKEGLLIRLGLRQLTSNLKQYIGVSVVLTIIVLFVCLTASYQVTFTEKYYNEIFGVVKSDMLIQGENFPQEKGEIEKIISKNTQITDSFYYSYKNVNIDNCQNAAQILDNSKYLSKVLEGRAPIYDNEIAITNLVKKQIGKGIGEKVVIDAGKDSKTYIISGIYDSCTDVGRCFTMTLDGVKRIDPTIKEDRRNYIIKDQSLSKEIMEKINKSYESKGIKASKSLALNENTMKTVLNASNIMIGFIYFMSILFAVITVAMLCNKVFYKERSDMGIYKACGFTSTELRIQFCVRFVVLSIISGIFGALIYLLVGNKINALVLSLAGISSFNAEVTFFNVALPGIMISFFVFLFSYIVMYKIKKIDIKELVME